MSATATDMAGSRLRRARRAAAAALRSATRAAAAWRIRVSVMLVAGVAAAAAAAPVPARLPWTPAAGEVTQLMAPVATGARVVDPAGLPTPRVETQPAPTRAGAGEPPLDDEVPPPRACLMAALALAGSALLGALALGGSPGAGVLVTTVAVLAAAWLLRRFLLGNPMPAPSQRTEPTGWGALPPPQTEPIAPLAAATPTGAALRLPPGFDLSAFLREARLSFVRLQSANDRADLADLRELATPQMYAALALQIGQRADRLRQVEVIALDAQLLALAVERDDAVASIRFHGSSRAEAGPPLPFTEVWQVRKSLADPRSAWLLDGIQQAT